MSGETLQRSLQAFIGKTVGNFQIQRCLGAGAMGAVFLAMHPKIGSQVAIKVLLPGREPTRQLLLRFLDEARAVNRIDHPGVVRIHDFDAREDIGTYLMMEYINGETLTQRFKARGAFDVDSVTRIMMQASSALCAAHDGGVIHRDLKPSNIILCEDPDIQGGERVKVLDFGVAKLISDSASDETRTGMKMGSPFYMSPEQCLDAKDVDARTDVYALGAIAYLLLSGRVPHAAKSFGQLVLQHQTQRPPPICSLNPAIPAALDQVILKALESDRRQRFSTMQDLREAVIEAILER